MGEKARSTLGDKLTDRIGKESYDVICGYDPPTKKLKNLATGKNIILKNNAHAKYPGETKDALINGLGADINYRNASWQGFEAEDLVATVDLGSVREINSIDVRFLQDQVVCCLIFRHLSFHHL